MAEKQYQDGKVPFRISERDTPCETYYKIFGDLSGNQPPVIILHGGPGSGHEYMTPYSALWTQYSIPTVFYDQIGCAASTHLPEKLGDKSFWQPSLFVAELNNLIKHLGIDRSNGPGYFVMGHSMGGTFAVAFAARQPPGLRRLILANANASSQLLKQNIWELSKKLGPEHYRAIEEAVEKEDFTSPAFAASRDALMSTYLCRAKPYPPPLLRISEQHQMEDRTTRLSMQGRSTYLYDGSMKHWSNVPLLPKINVPTLVFYGEFDTATEKSTVPFFDHIPRVRWYRMNGASHMPHLDSPEFLEKSLQLVSGFLLQEGFVSA